MYRKNQQVRQGIVWSKDLKGVLGLEVNRALWGRGAGLRLVEIQKGPPAEKVSFKRAFSCQKLITKQDLLRSAGLVFVYDTLEHTRHFLWLQFSAMGFSSPCGHFRLSWPVLFGSLQPQVAAEHFIEIWLIQTEVCCDYKVHTRLQNLSSGTSLEVQWWRLHESSAEGIGLIPGQGTKIPHAVWRGQNQKLWHGKMQNISLIISLLITCW